ncbi:MAG: biotin--[acetyl-CoA-carboxylase] ligase [Helicobacteraceae bacterium]|nr:biotin--[acetyl-CoA-carboxylase] ligase [Helicobacteraceae bacterium]
MEIKTFKILPSTQEYLISKLKNKEIQSETCILTDIQNSGIGSRGNKWNKVENGLYFSFCKQKISLPNDLQIQSISIFFGFILKENLAKLGSSAWLKYPNDLYIETQKIGGILCNVVGDFVVCGIGINLDSKSFESLENGIIKDKIIFLQNYFNSISNYTWNNIFGLYKNEFYKNYDFSFHYENQILSFRDSILCEDGAVLINNKKIYSAR